MRSREAPAPTVPILVFRLGAEEFGVDVLSAYEVLRPGRIASVPQAPPFIEGVMELRGTLLPVIDLRRRFELPGVGGDGDARLIVTRLAGERIGVLVDSVSEVLPVPETDLTPPPAYFRGLAAEYIRCIARLEERLILVIDLERILSSEERIALAQAEEWTASPADASSG